MVGEIKNSTTITRIIILYVEVWTNIAFSPYRMKNVLDELTLAGNWRGTSRTSH